MSMKRSEQFLAGITSGLMVATCLVSYQAWGDGNNATESQPREIAYQGTLYFNADPEPQEVKMRFSLYNSDTLGAPDACDDPAAVGCVWQELWDVVPLYDGRFFVSLGQHNNMDEDPTNDVSTVIYDGEALYLGIEVQREGVDAGWVPLANRQRINPAPYALWATQASHFNVASDLTVGGTVHVDEAITAGAPNGSPSVLRGGEHLNSTSQGVLRIEGGTGGPMIIDGDEIDVSDTLHINGVSRQPVLFGGRQEVAGDIIARANLNVTGVTTTNALTATGATDLNGNLDVAGATSVNALTARQSFTANGGAAVNEGLTIGGGSMIGRIAHGAIGRCYTNRGDIAGGANLVETPLPSGFSNATLVFLQVSEIDSGGCTHARLEGSNSERFRWRGYVGGTPTNCGCIFWTAIDPLL